MDAIAHREGGPARGQYEDGTIVEIGSQDVNGSLRPLCPPAARYIGVDFVAGKGVDVVLEDPYKLPLGDASVDVVNASGVVGHHLDGQSVRPLVAELKRVLRAEGIAMLDVGPSLGEPELTALLQAAGFRKLGRWHSWWLDPYGQVVYRRQGAVSDGPRG